MYDETSNNWVYAVKDSRGSFIPSGSVVGKDPPPSGVTKHLRPSPRMQPSGVRVSSVVGILSAPPTPDKVVPPTGTANIPVILINFNDTTTTYNSSNFNTLIFGNGTNSMKDYYEEVSYGTFSISPGPAGVVGGYTATYGHDYYGQNDAYGNDKWPGDLVYEAVAAADPAVDFSAYDSDGDCAVDVVAIVHQGTGEETGAGSPTDIWSHRWSLYGAWYYGYSQQLHHQHHLRERQRNLQ